MPAGALASKRVRLLTAARSKVSTGGASVKAAGRLGVDVHARRGARADLLVLARSVLAPEP